MGKGLGGEREEKRKVEMRSEEVEGGVWRREEK